MKIHLKNTTYFHFVDPALKKVVDFQKWFEKRLDDAIQAADKERPKAIQHEESDKNEEIIEEPVKKIVEKPKPSGDPNGAVITNFGFKPLSALALKLKNAEEDTKLLDEEKKKTDSERKKNAELQRKLESTQEELMRTQIRYQKEIEKLENQNRELRKQLLLRGNPSEKTRKIKKSLIDMYSEVLDELSGKYFVKTVYYVI